MLYVRRISMLVLAASLLAACGGIPAAEPAQIAQPTVAVPTPSALPPAATPVEEQTTTTPPTVDTAATSGLSTDPRVAAMQQTLDAFSSALKEGNQDQLLAAIDQKNAPFKRAQLENLKFATEDPLASTHTFDDTIAAILDRDDGYVQATVISTPSSGSAATMTLEGAMIFKQIDGTWLLTEPRRAELGKKLKHETEHFTIEYYAWDAEVIDLVAEAFEGAYTSLRDKLGKVPEGRFQATVVPTFEATPGGGGFWRSQYRPGSKEFDPDRIAVRSPHSNGFGTYDMDNGVENAVQAAFTASFAYLVVNRAFIPQEKLVSWMTVGISEHVTAEASPFRLALLKDALANDKLIPLQDRSNAVEKQDLEHLDTLNQGIELAIQQAQELVDFIHKSQGGYEGWWAFAGKFAETQNLEATVQDQLQLSLAEFEAQYVAFMKQKYGID